ncbi:LOW QUALITY PROTEIN: EVE domain-containing protein [Dulcicalothrix desertica PCC 7102]|nr:LOW QUALITY PROTEIN: EVE domain-containing protein [Dulcicalothrix desertica PCC 7102]
MDSHKYWIVVASKNHVQNGVLGSFMQACHGKASPLRRLQPDDLVIYYSPKQIFEGEEKCQAFTAIGRVVENSVNMSDMNNGFMPFRRSVEFFDCNEVSIIPLIPNLHFIKNKRNWGYVFRYGLFEIQQPDFDLIHSQMCPTCIENRGSVR